MTFDAPMPPPPPITPVMQTSAYATWIYRVGAFLIDIIPVAILDGIGFAVGGFKVTTTTDPYTGVTTSTTSAPSPLYWITVLLVIGYTIWNMYYRQGKTGQSIGKSVLGIKLIKESTGEPLGGWLCFGRYLLHLLDELPCFIGFLWPLWDAKRQTFADKLVSSVVIRVEK
jgi:uncharacterized RDD family membrane protein YckC